jgi:ankyrin repeat protein
LKPNELSKIDHSLLESASFGIEDDVRTLIECGANIESCTKQGETALMLSASNGYHETASLLLDLGADIEAGRRSDGRTALLFASAMGFTETIKVLLDRGAKIDGKDKRGSTALMLAAAGGHEHAARYLIDRGADINLTDSYGRTALNAVVSEWRWLDDTLTSSRAYQDVIRLLIDKGAKTTIADNERCRTIHHSIMANKPSVLALLLERGESPYGDMPDGRTFEEACATKPECLAVLQAHRNKLAIDATIRDVLRLTRAPALSL